MEASLHLMEAWTVWKAQCRRQYEAGLGLVRKQKAGFRKGKGVCYKILDSIDVEDQHLYLVPSSEFPGVQASGVSEYFWGAQVWQGELPQSHASVYWSVRFMHWKEKMAMHNIHALECTQNYIASYLMMICMKGVSLQWKPWALKVSTC